MKQTIKIIAILVIATFVFSLYPMETPDYYSADIDRLRENNPLLHTNNFNTEIDNNADCRSTSKDNLIHKNKGLDLSLTAVRLLAELDKVENKETFETIYNAVREGTPITFKYSVKLVEHCFFVFIFPKKSSISIFTFTENLFEHPLPFANNDHVNKKRLWMEAIFRGQHKRQETLEWIRTKSRTHVRSTLKIDIPEDIILSILLPHLQEDNEEERKVLIEQAKTKFNREQQQLQLNWYQE